MKNKISLQELSEFLQKAAYADNLKHGIEWSLSVIHPKTDWGAVGFSGGIWHKPLSWFILEWRKEIEHKRDGRPRITINFSFDEMKGIYNFEVFEDRENGKSGAKYELFGGKPNFDEFKETIIQKFGIEKIFAEEICK